MNNVPVPKDVQDSTGRKNTGVAQNQVAGRHHNSIEISDNLEISVKRGKYALACEKSPYKVDIDTWLNEGKSYSWISKQLELLGDPISPNSVSKYAKHRQAMVSKKLMEDPTYQDAVNHIKSNIQDGITQVKQLDLMGQLDDVISSNSSLIARYAHDVVIETAQDLRYVSQSVIQAIEAKGKLALMSQKHQSNAKEMEENNGKLSAGGQMKSVLSDILAAMTPEERTSLIDKMRNGL